MLNDTLVKGAVEIHYKMRVCAPNQKYLKNYTWCITETERQNFSIFRLYLLKSVLFLL